MTAHMDTKYDEAFLFNFEGHQSFFVGPLIPLFQTSSKTVTGSLFSSGVRVSQSWHQFPRGSPTFFFKVFGGHKSFLWGH